MTMENRQRILSDKHILGKLNEHGLTNAVMEAMTDYAQEQANKNFAQPDVSGMFSLAVVKNAFETFRYRGFPHNAPTWDEWAKENLR